MPNIDVTDAELLAIVKHRAIELSDYANTTETIENLKLVMDRLAELAPDVDTVLAEVRQAKEEADAAPKETETPA